MHGIVLFDGECNFCDASVQFIMKRDHKAYFRFASIQSDIGQQLLTQYKVPTEIDSIIYIEQDTYFIRSTAALRIASRLDGAWPALKVLQLVPTFVRDSVYKFIARHRYKIFGKKDACMLPTAEQRNRFL